jgi:fructose/tagatose bisphosphate aldolase
VLLTNRNLLVPARRKGYAVEAFNINNLEALRAVTEATTEEKSPAIIAVTPGSAREKQDVPTWKFRKSKVKKSR